MRYSEGNADKGRRHIERDPGHPRTMGGSRGNHPGQGGSGLAGVGSRGSRDAAGAVSDAQTTSHAQTTPAAVRRSGLSEDAVHLCTAHRTRALGHAAPGVAGDDLALEVALLLALHAVAVVGLGHVASSLPLMSLSALKQQGRSGTRYSQPPVALWQPGAYQPPWNGHGHPLFASWRG